MLGFDARAARATWTVLVIAAGVAIVWALRHLLLVFAFSVFFAYLIYPLVGIVQRWLPLAHRRSVAIAVVYAVLVVGVVAAGAGVVPRISEEVALLARKIPEMTLQIQTGQIVPNVVNKPAWEDTRIQELQMFVRTHAGEIIGYAQQAAAKAVKWLAGAWVIVLIPIFAFFILKDAEGFLGWIEARLIAEGPRRELWRDILEDVHVLLGHYVRALILLSLITFVVWSVLLMLTKVPYAMVLAAIGGTLEFIPVVGPLVAGVIVISVAVFTGFGHPWLIALFVLVWRGIQDYGTSPLIMGRGVEVHPALVIFGVIAGGEIAGPAGMFLSVPILAAARIVWRRLRAFYATKRLWKPPLPEEPAP